MSIVHSKFKVNADTLDCPVCHADWRLSKIPEQSKQHYRKGAVWFSKLIGVEMGEDRTDHWRCPNCATTFNR